MNTFHRLFILFILFPLYTHAVLINGFPTPNPTFPDNLNSLTYVFDLNGAYLVKDTSTNRFYVLKTNVRAEAMKEEILADALYRTLGINVPDFAVYSYAEARHVLPSDSTTYNPNAPIRLTPYIEKHTSLSEPDLMHLQETALKDHLIADAFLSNWDILVRKERANTLIDTNKVFWRIDNGGSLLRRAQGKFKKTNHLWSATRVTELETFKDPSVTPWGASLFKQLTQDEIITQIHNIISHEKDLIATLEQLHALLRFVHYDALHRFLCHRLDHLTEHYNQHMYVRHAYPTQPKADPYKRITNPEDNSFVCLSNLFQGNLYILLNYSPAYLLFTPLGGKPNHEDKFFYETAAHKFNNENGQFIVLNPSHVLSAPFHESLMGQRVIRTYFVPFDPQAHTNPYVHTSLDRPDKLNLFKFAWVSVESIMDYCLLNSNLVGNERLPITGKHHLHPKLSFVFSHPSIKSILAALSSGSRPPSTRETSITSSLTPATSASYVNLNHLNTHHTHARAIVAKGAALRALKSSDRPTLAQGTPKSLQVMQEFVQIRTQNALAHVQSAATPLVGHFAHAPLTQTQSFLKTQMGPDYRDPWAGENHYNYAKYMLETYCAKHSNLLGGFEQDEDYIHSLATLFVQELQTPRMAVFYHATTSEMAFMYDVFTEFRRQLMISDIGPILALRGTEEAFKYLNSIDDFYGFYSSMNPDVINYASQGHRNYTDQGLCANFSLVGCDFWETSCSAYMFHLGNSKNPPRIEDLYEEFCEQLGFKGRFDPFQHAYNRFVRSVSSSLNGAMIQFFIHPDVLSDVAYMAIPGGQKLSTHTPTLGEDHFRVMTYLSCLRLEQERYASLHKACLDRAQVRLFLKPDILLNPALCQTYTHWRRPQLPSDERAYRLTLKRLVQDEIARMLVSMRPDHNSALLCQSHYSAAPDETTGSAPKFQQPPLVKLYKQTAENVTSPAQNWVTEFKKLVLLKAPLESLEEFLDIYPDCDVNILVNHQNSAITFYILNHLYTHAYYLFSYHTFDPYKWSKESEEVQKKFLFWGITNLQWSADHFLFLNQVHPDAQKGISESKYESLYLQTLGNQKEQLWYEVFKAIDPKEPNSQIFYKNSALFIAENNPDLIIHFLNSKLIMLHVGKDTLLAILKAAIQTGHTMQIKCVLAKLSEYSPTIDDFRNCIQGCITAHLSFAFTLAANHPNLTLNLRKAIVCQTIQLNLPEELIHYIQDIPINEGLTDDGERAIDIFAYCLFNTPNEWDNDPELVLDYIKTLNLLLKAGATAHQPNDTKPSPLQIIGGNGYPDIDDETVHYFEGIYLKLLTAGANPNGTSLDTYAPPLFNVLKMGNNRLTIALLDQGADPTFCFRIPLKNACIFACAYPPCNLLCEALFCLQRSPTALSPGLLEFMHRYYKAQPESFTFLTNLLRTNKHLTNILLPFISSFVPASPERLPYDQQLEFYIAHHCHSELKALLQKPNPPCDLEHVPNSRMIVHGKKYPVLPALLMAGFDKEMLILLLNAGAQINTNHPFFGTDYKKIKEFVDKHKLTLKANL